MRRLQGRRQTHITHEQVQAQPHAHTLHSTHAAPGALKADSKAVRIWSNFLLMPQNKEQGQILWKRPKDCPYHKPCKQKALLPGKNSAQGASEQRSAVQVFKAHSLNLFCLSSGPYLISQSWKMKSSTNHHKVLVRAECSDHITCNHLSPDESLP